jgi:hypothetical protein
MSWDRVKRRYEAFWAQGLHDRPLIAVSAPRAHARPAAGSRVPADDASRWTDPDVMVEATLGSLDRTFLAGESLPVLYHNWSAGHALPFGCEPHFARDTVWVDPAPDGPDGFPVLDGWRFSPWWEWMLRCTSVAARRSGGRYFVMPVWGNHAGDTLGLVRGPQRFMQDVAEEREWVRHAVRRMSDILLEQLQELWPLVSPSETGLEGSINYVSLWSPGRSLGFDCDVSCMISTRDFEDLFLPPLVETMRTVDHRIYHLDGPGAVHHLDLLLSIPEIDAVQWVPGDGAPGVLHWVPLIRRIQAAGKSVAVYAQPAEVMPLLDDLRPEGLYVGVSCAREEEARDLLAAVSARFGSQS